MTHYDDGRVRVLHGDCLDVLLTLPAASVDAVVTDPPYGLGFMGQKWDTYSGEVNRAPSQRAGFDHVGGNHNPTSSADAARTRRVEAVRFGEWCERWAAECLRVLKPGGHLLAFGGTRTFHRLAVAVEDAGFEIRDEVACLLWMYASGFPKSLNLDGDWQGWGTALKPAWEPVIVARKPLAGTVAANVLTHGTGALNIDACRVEGDPRPLMVRTETQVAASSMSGTSTGATSSGELTTAGRWPANLVLTHHPDCGDRCAPGCHVAELDQQSGQLTSGKMMPTHTTAGAGGRPSAYGADSPGGFVTMETYGDTGGASRFYPVFRYTAKAPGTERPRAGGVAHPTVKPVDLMRWLVRLVTPPGGLVLDPFAGSGTTGEACQAEGVRALLIEREADYLPLITQRLTKRTDPVQHLAARDDTDLGLFELLTGEDTPR